MHRIWFLTGSQGLYGEDVLAQVGDDGAGHFSSPCGAWP